MKIAIAHRSSLALRAIELAVKRGGQHEVAWAVLDGSDAMRRCLAQAPDVLLLDATFRNPSAAEVTRRLMDAQPSTVLLLAEKMDGSLSAVYEAMGVGAADVVACPRLDDRGELHGDQALNSKLLTMSRIIGQNLGRRQSTPQPFRLDATRLIAIGASTGGPQAIHGILKSLPRPVTSPIVIVQHVDSEFALGLAEWLSEGTGIPVKIATPGSLPEPGCALLAGTGSHLVLTGGGVFTYVEEPKNVAYRPSVDTLFFSLAAHSKKPGVAALLTGMGRDGAEGLLRLRNAGWRTIAQDEGTSIVYGMPKAAAKLGAAERVLPISDVAAAIGRMLER